MFIKKIFMFIFFILIVGVFTASDNNQVKVVEKSVPTITEDSDEEYETDSEIETNEDVIIIRDDVSAMARKLKSYNINKVSDKKITKTTAKNSSEGNYSSVIASFYGEYFHGKTTANGETYDMNALTAAHKTLPLGTIAKVTNLDNNKSVIVRINDRGPYIEGREIDLSKGSFSKIGNIEEGLINVAIEIIELGNNKYVKSSK